LLLLLSPSPLLLRAVHALRGVCLVNDTATPCCAPPSQQRPPATQQPHYVVVVVVGVVVVGVVVVVVVRRRASSSCVVVVLVRASRRYKRAQSGAWILRQFVLTGEGVLQSQKVEAGKGRSGANKELTTEELIAQANADFQAGKRESLNAKTPRRSSLGAGGRSSSAGSGSAVGSGAGSSSLIKDKFRLDPGNEFEAQISQTSEVDFTLVEDGTRLRAKDEADMNAWMTNLRNLYVLAACLLACLRWWCY
jgi:hypothetical protein